MKKRDYHEQYDFFESIRLHDASVPPPSRDRIDVAILDMNHSWPNVGHDSLIHAVLEAAEEFREALVAADTKVRVISFDVRRKHLLPEDATRYAMYVATGGPGHLDPRLNDGVAEYSQGIAESVEWEAPLFRLFESIHRDRDASLLAVCHSFGLLCRWSGIAHPELRREKSSGMPVNVLAPEAKSHPWFSEFAAKLPDHEHFRVVDNRLFDLVLDRREGFTPIAYEERGSDGVTMVELARDASGTMPRILGVNHHPEIIDRDHILTVLEEKRAHAEVTEQWYRERVTTMRDMFQGEAERQSRLTSHYSLTGVVRFHIARAVGERCEVAAASARA